MKIKLSTSGKAYNALFVREDVIQSPYAVDSGTGIDVQLADDNEFESLLGELKSIETVDLQVVDDSGETRETYKGYKLSRAFKSYVSDTDEGFVKKLVTRFNKVG